MTNLVFNAVGDQTVDGTPTNYTYTSGTSRLASVGGSSITTDSFGRITAAPSYT